MIRGESVNLRAVERTDASAIYGWFNDPDVTRWLGEPAASPSLALIQRHVEAWLEEEAGLDRPTALLIQTLDDEAIGLIVLSEYRPEARSSQLSILIGNRSHWGQGFGSDALRTVVDVCFHEWNLHRVWLRTEAGNRRAHRMYERCGFRLEATLRDAAFLDGRFEDVLVFSILENEPIESEPGKDSSDGELSPGSN
jgi:ribosomal-protein-alanine N-acetyltransferase